MFDLPSPSVGGGAIDPVTGALALGLGHVAVEFGLRILDVVPGRVSTEVDARLSYDTDATLEWDVAQGVEMQRPSRLHVTAERRGGEVVEVRVAGSAVVACRGTINVP